MRLSLLQFDIALADKFHMLLVSPFSQRTRAACHSWCCFKSPCCSCSMRLSFGLFELPLFGWVAAPDVCVRYRDNLGPKCFSRFRRRARRIFRLRKFSKVWCSCYAASEQAATQCDPRWSSCCTDGQQLEIQLVRTPLTCCGPILNIGFTEWKPGERIHRDATGIWRSFDLLISSLLIYKLIVSAESSHSMISGL